MHLTADFCQSFILLFTVIVAFSSLFLNPFTTFTHSLYSSYTVLTSKFHSFIHRAPLALNIHLFIPMPRFYSSKLIPAAVPQAQVSKLTVFMWELLLESMYWSEQLWLISQGSGRCLLSVVQRQLRDRNHLSRGFYLRCTPLKEKCVI